MTLMTQRMLCILLYSFMSVKGCKDGASNKTETMGIVGGQVTPYSVGNNRSLMCVIGLAICFSGLCESVLQMLVADLSILARHGNSVVSAVCVWSSCRRKIGLALTLNAVAMLSVFLPAYSLPMA